MKIYLNIAVKAALLAGEEILKVYNDEASDFGIEIKADNSPLTIADKLSNDVICRELKSSCLPIL
ncbi:MAG: 3'(2'),5'-bisphosphate nucleotidase CysQ, partial [Paludibacteraceae bacterium]|nr:3'(2'),5'-bisphosphate nucleotidase CysQ [Paludibacteraceae bacterium]